MEGRDSAISGSRQLNCQTKSVNIRSIITFSALAAATAVAASSSCTATVSGQAQASGPDRLAITLSGLAAALDPPLSPSGSAPLPTLDVTGRGLLSKIAADPPMRFGPTATPGVAVRFQQPNGSGTLCTVGPVVRHVGGAFDGFVTAGHCADNDVPASLQTTSDPHRAKLLSAVTGSMVYPAGNPAKFEIDSEFVMTERASPAAVRIAGVWPVEGVLTEAAVRRLPESTTEVCYAGTVSGVVCGPLNFINNKNIAFAASAGQGNSGSAVFVVNAATDAAALIGTVSASGGGITVATYLEPTLERLHLTALVDPTAAASVSGDPRYSAAVSPLE